MNSIISGIFSTTGSSEILLIHFLVCMGTALLLGIGMSFLYGKKNRTTKSFLTTYAMLPMIVSMVIMMVNGNIGAGVAVAGAFSLVRFRSVPGSAKEICAIFSAMCVGLTIGMGYIVYAVLFAVIASMISYILQESSFGKETISSKTLYITVPENLNFYDAFDDILNAYADSFELTSVKTTNMGSLFKLTFDIQIKDDTLSKELIDQLRCRNGNLEILLAKKSSSDNVL